MGTDIYWYAEKKNAQNKWEFACADYTPQAGVEDDNFTINRNYRLFHWLGGVPRGTFTIAPFAAERGIPNDTSWDHNTYGVGASYRSWVDVAELVKFDYDGTYGEIDEPSVRTLVRDTNGVFALTEAEKMSCREAFRPEWFEFLNKLVATGAQRMLFGFE